jgi:thiol-disulfide isomerase/thioredoxin
MPMRIKLFPAFCLAALSLSTLAPAPVSAAEAKSKAAFSMPAFSIPDLEGKAHDSKEWKGKVVVLDFWATWCVSCRETIPVLNRLNGKFADKGLLVIGISTDNGPQDKIAKFARKLKMEYQVLWDSEEALSNLFGFMGLPSLYVFDREGKLLKAMPQYTAAREQEMETLVESQFQK